MVKQTTCCDKSLYKVIIQLSALYIMSSSLNILFDKSLQIFVSFPYVNRDYENSGSC